MTDSGVAKRYARALFSAAKKQNIVNTVDDDLAGVVETLRASDKFRTFLKKPQTTPPEKRIVFDKAFDGKVNPLTLDFIRMLVKRRREDQIYQIQIEFAELRRIDENVTKAVFTSAMELDKDEQEKVIKSVEAKVGHKLEPEFVVDPSVMGGIKVAYDNLVLDGTVRGSLNKLREKMIYDLLKQA